MTAMKEAPYYQYDAHKTNNPAFQISQLVRSGADARRLLVPIHDWAHLSRKSQMAEQVESILNTWDEPGFPDRADRALQILKELDAIWTAGNGVDMMDLGERRVPLYALYNAIVQRCCLDMPTGDPTSV